jgi:hypothetical protein
MTWRVTDEIVKEVQLRGIWRTDEEGIEHALGVHVVPYPNGNFVVWVAMALMKSN